MLTAVLALAGDLILLPAILRTGRYGAPPG